MPDTFIGSNVVNLWEVWYFQILQGLLRCHIVICAYYQCTNASTPASSISQAWKQPSVAGRYRTSPHAQLSARTSISAPADLSSAGLKKLFGAEAPGNASFVAQVISGTDSGLPDGHTLYDNKGILLGAISNAINQTGASMAPVTEQEQAIVLAVAMQV